MHLQSQQLWLHYSRQLSSNHNPIFNCSFRQPDNEISKIAIHSSIPTMRSNKQWLVFLTFFCHLTPDCHLQQLENPRDNDQHSHQHQPQGLSQQNSVLGKGPYFDYVNKFFTIFLPTKYKQPYSMTAVVEFCGRESIGSTQILAKKSVK